VLRRSPLANGDSTRTVPRTAVVTVLGAAGSWLRVRLPGGEAGFVTATAVQRVGDPITVVSREAGVVLRERPSPAAVIVDSLDNRARLSVLGRYGRWLLVATDTRREGWIAE
jgi:hypothetical protein